MLRVAILIVLFCANAALAQAPLHVGHDVVISTWGNDLADDDVVWCDWVCTDLTASVAYTERTTQGGAIALMTSCEMIPITHAWNAQIINCRDSHGHNSRDSQVSQDFWMSAYHPAVPQPEAACVMNQESLNAVKRLWHVGKWIVCDGDPASECYCDGDPFKTCENPEFEWFVDIDWDGYIGQSDLNLVWAEWQNELCYQHWQAQSETCEMFVRPTGSGPHETTAPEQPTLNEHQDAYCGVAE